MFKVYLLNIFQIMQEVDIFRGAAEQEHDPTVVVIEIL